MTKWNQPFTGLIRQTRPSYWGNWSLNMQIKPGSVGIVDPDTGEFRVVAESIPGAKIDDIPASNAWKLASDHISRKESKADFDGTVIDPDTGTKITAGMEVKWEMSKAEAIASEFALSRESTVNKFGDLLHQNMDFLAKTAESVGMSSNGEIAQGFGVVTSVLWAKSGLNIGSQEDQGSFSLSGSVSGINQLVGKATGKGSYVAAKQERSFEQHLWPEKSGIIAATEVPIAYTFASFDKKLLIPNWIMQLGAFELVLVNQVGCTYITKAKLTYDTPEGHKEEKADISGGLTKTIGNIPLNATNLQLNITFKGVLSDDHYSFHWDKPLGQWLTGQRHIDMSGVWPGKTHCKERESR